MKRTTQVEEENNNIMVDGQTTLTSDGLAQRLGGLLNTDFDQSIMHQMAARNITGMNQLTQLHQ